MSTTIRLDLDDAKVAAGFKRIAQSVKDSSATIAAATNGMHAPMTRYTAQMKAAEGQTKKTAQVSSEGLGFVASALGRLNPQLAMVGEQTVKQLPTLMKWGTTISKMGIVGGAFSAIAGSVAKVAFGFAQLNKEAVSAETTLGRLIDNVSQLDQSATITKLLNRGIDAGLGMFGGASRDEIQQQMREEQTKWKMNDEKSGDPQKVIRDQMAKSLEMQAKLKDAGGGMMALNSTADIQQKIELEKKRIDGLAQLGKLTEEEAQVSAAYQSALIARYDEINERMNDLYDLQQSIADEQETRWVAELKNSQEATKQLQKYIGEYRRLHNTDQLTEQRRHELLQAMNALQGRKLALLGEEKQKQIELTEQVAARLALESKAAFEQLKTDKERAAAKLAQWRGEKEHATAIVKAAGGGGDAAAGPNPVGRAGGWQAWGGAARVPQLQDFWRRGGGGGAGGQGGQGGEGGAGGDPAADLLGMIDRGVNHDEIRKHARIVANKKMRAAAQAADDAFGKELKEIAGQDWGGDNRARADAIEAARKARNIARRKAVADRDGNEVDEVGKQTKEARGKVRDALEAQGSINNEQALMLKQLGDEALAGKAERERQAAEIKALRMQLDAAGIGRQMQRKGNR